MQSVNAWVGEYVGDKFVLSSDLREGCVLTKGCVNASTAAS
jgi:hypothetical protein